MAGGETYDMPHTITGYEATTAPATAQQNIWLIGEPAIARLSVTAAPKAAFGKRICAKHRSANRVHPTVRSVRRGLIFGDAPGDASNSSPPIEQRSMIRIGSRAAGGTAT